MGCGCKEVGLYGETSLTFALEVVKDYWQFKDV
jgi:hypothetical protein